jgi:hypothetical protein
MIGTNDFRRIFPPITLSDYTNPPLLGPEYIRQAETREVWCAPLRLRSPGTAPNGANIIPEEGRLDTGASRYDGPL